MSDHRQDNLSLLQFFKQRNSPWKSHNLFSINRMVSVMAYVGELRGFTLIRDREEFYRLICRVACWAVSLQHFLSELFLSAYRPGQPCLYHQSDRENLPFPAKLY